MDIYSEILSALDTEERVMLATIISTSGSTPASALSKMLVKQNGIISVGTVGGGCMEGDVLLHANRLLTEQKAEILKFHLNEDDLEHGLICGGSLEVLIEPVTKENIPLFRELQSFKNEGEDSLLVTHLANNGIIKGKYLIPEHRLRTSSKDFLKNIAAAISIPAETFEQQLQNVFHRQETERFKTDGGEIVFEPVTGSPDLIIFGGGHVSKFISRTASMAGFRVTIVDDRQKYSNPKRFPEAVKTFAVDFMKAFESLSVKQSSYIVIVTRGHRFDEDILEYALQTPAKYIGMIGSKRKVLTTYEHLVNRGVTIDSLRKVHAPIGIEISAVTPEEIGISVAAQLIRARRGEQTLLQNKSEVMLELLAMLEQHSLTHK